MIPTRLLPAALRGLVLAAPLALLAACNQTGTGAAQAAAKAPGVPADYPLDVCLVTGEKLGEHGAPYAATLEGEKVYLCCDGCVDDLNAKPATYAAILHKAEKTHGAH